MDFTILIALPMAIVLAILVGLFIFRANFGFSKGRIVGAYEFILRDTPHYFMRRSNLSDVTTTVFKDKEKIIDTLLAEIDAPYSDDIPKEKKEELRTFLTKVDPRSMNQDKNYDIGAFVLSSLFGKPLLAFVMYRATDDKGTPTPFPNNKSLNASKSVWTTSGVLTRGLIEAFYFPLPNPFRFEGLGTFQCAFMLPYDDSNVESLRPSINKILGVLTSFYSALPNVARNSSIIKSQKDDLKRLERINKEYLSEINRLGGSTNAQERVVKYFTRGKGGGRLSGSLSFLVTGSLYFFPILFAFVFQDAFNTNPILGVILGETLAIMIFLSRK